jgi:hypothetical protein
MRWTREVSNTRRFAYAHSQVSCRHGQAELIISVQAKLALLANALFPNCAALVCKSVNRTLPRAGPAGEAKPGWKVRGNFPPAAVTFLPDKASRANNELPP